MLAIVTLEDEDDQHKMNHDDRQNRHRRLQVRHRHHLLRLRPSLFQPRLHRAMYTLRADVANAVILIRSGSTAPLYPFSPGRRVFVISASVTEQIGSEACY